MTSGPSQFSLGLRFCGSCVVTLVCWVVWLALGTTLAGLLYVAVAKELPVPDFVLRRVEAELARANFVIRFGRASFDPTGKLLLEDVQLRTKQFEDPLLTSRLVYVRRSIWSILSGRPQPDEIRLEGAVLQLPAMLSPSGVAEPLVRDLAATVRHEDNVWRVDQLTGRIGPLAVTAQGALAVAARPASAIPFHLEEITARFLALSRRLALGVHQLDAFEEPNLAVRLDNPEGIGNTATLLFTARELRPAQLAPLGAVFGAELPLTVGPLAVTTTLRLEGSAARLVRLHAAVGRAGYPGGFSAENVRAIFTAQVLPEQFYSARPRDAVRPLEALIAAGRVTAEDEQALAPVVRASLADWPAVRTTIATQIRGEFLAAEVEAELVKKSALIRAEGRADGGFISTVLRKHTPRAASYFVFGDPVNFRAEAVLAPGWRFASLTSRVAAGRLDSHGVQLTAARGRIDITGLSFLAHDARVELGGNFARGSYWMDFSTTDYRMLLTGQLKPPVISGWFKGDWWLNFWNRNFAFPGAPPAADVDVHGRWKEVARTVYFGRADTQAAVVLGGDFEQAHTLIFLRPYFTHALELSATRAGGTQQLTATFKRFADPATHETNRLEFTADANVGAETYRRMAGGKADALLASLRFAAPPRVHAAGAVTGTWPGAVPAITFSGAAAGGLHFYGFPLDTVAVTGGISGAELRLEDIQFTLAGGKGAGKALLNGPPAARRLGFDVKVAGADLARTIRAVEEYQANRTGRKGESMTESKFMKRASGGRLDAALVAAGTPGDIASFTGTGNAALAGAELAEIHLFGLLSQVLSGLSLNFSSLKLDAARTSFKMENGRLNFPDLRISGPSAVIDARGSFVFATNALDFTAKFKPFEESRNPLTAVIGIVINPITSILELKLSGPLSKPDWSIVVGPSSPRPEAPAPTPKTAEPVVPVAPAEKSDPPKS